MKIILLFMILPAMAFAQEQPIEKNSLATLSVEGFPDFLAADADGIWVTNTNRVEKFIYGKSTPVMTVSMPEPCGVMAVGFGSLWAVSCKEKALYRINLLSGKIDGIIQTGICDPAGELSVALGDGSAWMLTNNDGELSRIDPSINKIIARIKVRANSYVCEYGFNSVWVTNSENSTVQRIDPKTNQVVSTITVGPTPRFITSGAGAVWTLNQGDGTVSKIDPAINQVTETISVGTKETGGDIATGQHKVFVRGKKYMLSVIDAANNKVVSRFGPAAGSGAVRVENGHVWVTAHDVNKIWILEE